MEKIILLAALIGAILAMAQFPKGLTMHQLANAKTRRRRRSFG